MRILAALSLAVVAGAQAPPNIIVIFTDDQGWADLGVYGSPHIRTPNIDRMAAEGVRFTDFYAQPFCGPSRAALLTGTYPPRNNLMFNHGPNARTGIHPNEITIAELLKPRGYATMIIGKWHLGDAPEFLPTRHGFDQYFGLPYSNDMWPYHPRIKPGPDAPAIHTAMRRRGEVTGYDGREKDIPATAYPPLKLVSGAEVIELNPDQTKLTEAYTAKAIEFIRGNKARPFFLYLAHNMPHVPLFPGAKFASRSARGLYGDVVEEIDDSTGRILAALKDLNIEQRTLVIFTSDNGPWLQYGIDGGSAGPLRAGKGTHFEGGVRVPFIARYPGRIPAGRVTSEVAANIDLLPTFARLAGAQVPADRVIDGRDIWPLMTESAAKSPREFQYYFSGRTAQTPFEVRAVRSGPWKYHASGELYHLLHDVSEKQNVASAHPEIVQRLSQPIRSFDEELRGGARPLGRLSSE